MVLLLVFMQLTRDLFAIAKFLLSYAMLRINRQTDGGEYFVSILSINKCLLASHILTIDVDTVGGLLRFVQRRGNCPSQCTNHHVGL